MKKIFITLLLILQTMFVFPFISGAADFSFAINQYAGIDGQGKEKKDINFDYQANFIPGFSHYFNDSCEIFLSAGIMLGWEEKFKWVPELLRAEFSWHKNNLGIRVGRINYADPIGIIASGLFDGMSFSYTSMIGTISLGAWYTGLLYKKTANISMNSRDYNSYVTPFDYNDFKNTYFASRRLLASFDWEHPSIGNFMRLKAAVTAQVDLSPKNEEKYHSQYFTFKAVIPIKLFDFEFGGSVGLAQKKGAADAKPDNKETGVSLLGNFGVLCRLPSVYNSYISLTGSYLSGKMDNLMVFKPLSNKSYGNILKIKLLGISLLSLDYTAQFIPAIGFGVGASLFIRNDLDTFKAYPVNAENNEGNFLGTEFYTRLVWSPFTDLQFNLGGGIFLPALGNAAAPKEKPLWLAEISINFALY